MWVWLILKQANFDCAFSGVRSLFPLFKLSGTCLCKKRQLVLRLELLLKAFFFFSNAANGGVRG